MIGPELVARIRHLFFAEHWKVGTIAAELRLHRDTVRGALQSQRFSRTQASRPRLTDPYVEFIRETLQKYPRLRATRIYEMIRARGYQGSVVQVRRRVAELRPTQREAFLRLRTFPGEQGQVDWAHFGTVSVGRARRKLSGFVLTLSYSRALALEFFFDQSLENFLRAHVRALQRRRLKKYARPALLCIDELGYLAYDPHAADLLYEVVNRRYEYRSLLVTTNRAFRDWNLVFPNATCIATLLDRLTHHADLTVIEGSSYRVRASEEEAAARRRRKKR